MLDVYDESKVKIIQIIPAQGWGRVMAQAPDRPGESPMFVMPIICWALIEYDDGRRDIVGVDIDSSGDTGFVEQHPETIGVVGPGEDPEKFKKEAHEFVVRQEEKSRKENRRG